jgi:hypothetical protein
MLSALLASTVSAPSVYLLTLGLVAFVGIGVTAGIIGGISAAGSLAQGISSLTGDDDRGSRIRKIFEERYERLRDTSPAETGQFTAGVGALQEQADRQAETDASQAAARGLGGSQFAVAQDANRAEALGSSTRQLLGDSARSLQQRRQSTLGGLAEQANIQAEREARKQSRLGQIAGTGLQAATRFALANGGGGGG